MSKRGKFQNTEEWRQKMRERLLRLQVVEDFKAIAAARKAEREKQDQQKREQEMCEQEKPKMSICDDTMFPMSDDISNEFDGADESFAAYERMCDKTGSDPDSTLFQYLHSEDKEKVLAKVKERSGMMDFSSAKTHEMEVEALRRMLDQVNAHELLDNESPLKGVECSQLEDVEAPSRFWDNTVVGNESVFQPSTETSPVKMVGLMRPSTILEANEADLTAALSETSSSSSFHTALKPAPSTDTIASSCYETAADNSAGSGSNASSNLLNVDDLFYAAIAKAKPPGMSMGEEVELLHDLHISLLDCAGATNETLCDKVDVKVELHASLLDRDGDTNETLCDNADVKEETIIELSSDEEDEKKPEKGEPESSLSQCDFNDNKENEGESEKSVHFNDTMEEMEYFMQKGMEYIAAQAQTQVVTSASKLEPPMLQKQNTFTKSPKPMMQTQAESPVFAKPSTPLSSKNKTPLQAGAIKKQSNEILHFSKPKGKFFETPTSSIPTRRHLELKQPFTHIVSPIRAYMDKSGKAPLMTMFKPTIDAYRSMAFTELEHESRLCSSGAAPINELNFASLNHMNTNLLPKKAYISSEIKHIVDKRTPMPMPSVPKIQKFLDAAVEPSVLRHDGKAKMPTSGAASHIPRRQNLSLADLSLASGDISMYTIKDAQKF
ncbi:uncharacterized protein LOC115625888 isoform X2 [Scaptodrosophila lebanonensis]|uniref:Uncharacterized protein LOC115625888 isoform X2 n=1 Tax=Drosophila lebanonensis TaxID=7225 RepID=A0A6J2TJY5_DROLE|nr:uncharacterized protein LOC115625888 isoform X2 [Scaptodrosophila lebanonensis]